MKLILHVGFTHFLRNSEVCYSDDSGGLENLCI